MRADDGRQFRWNQHRQIETTPLERATDDYLYSFRLLRDFADYVALNVSSPNTPGLRELQEPAALSRLLRAIGSEPAGREAARCEDFA